MYCNTFSTKSFAIFCNLKYIRNIASSSVSQGSYFIDIDTKFCHFFYPFYCFVLERQRYKKKDSYPKKTIKKTICVAKIPSFCCSKIVAYFSFLLFFLDNYLFFCIY